MGSELQQSEVPILGGGTSNLLVPRANESAPYFIFPMDEVYRIENRLEDVKIVNISTYQELASEFNGAYNILVKYKAAVSYEALMLKSQLESWESLALIDEYPAWFQEKKRQGLSDNQQTRTAFLIHVSSVKGYYNKGRDKLNALTALEEYLNNKCKVFINAYQATKKVVEATSAGMGWDGKSKF